MSYRLHPDSRNRIAKSPSSSHGFTIIELLVVITVIGVLISLLLPALGKARDEAKLSVCLSQQHQLYLALLSFTYDRKDKPPQPSTDGNNSSFDAVTGLTGNPFSSTDPYRWIYTNMGQVWATGYFQNIRLVVCPGFVNHVNEVALGYQQTYIIQPGGVNNPIDRLVPDGVTINGIVSAPSGSQGYLDSTYSLNLSDPDNYSVQNWPVVAAAKIPLVKYPRNALMMCSQSVYNQNQLNPGMPWYLTRNADCHNRENMNCMYGDGVGRRLFGVAAYARGIYYDPNWTWQVCATNDPYGTFYWWDWANNQRN